MTSPAAPDTNLNAIQAKPGRGAFIGWVRRLGTTALLLTVLILFLQLDALIGGHGTFPSEENLSLGLLFVAGFFTGFHCVGMCGALVMAYTVSKPGARGLAHWQYAAGKTLSYTILGALFGAIGSVVTFTPFMRGSAGIAAGLFVLIFGLGMLNVLPKLSHFRIKTPGQWMAALGKAFRSYRHPFAIGMLNGLMVICGPLQAMYVMAAGTGSPWEGAKLLAVFGLGTLPMMLGFGFLAGAASRAWVPRLVRASGLVVMVLGAVMLNRGLAMIGSGYDYASLSARVAALSKPPVASVGADGHQEIHMDLKAGKADLDFQVLKKGVPVRWVIQGNEITACNHRLRVPSMGLDFELKPGQNVVEFTPEEAGPVPWSCEMGMTSGAFMVEEPDKAGATAKPLRARLKEQWENLRQAWHLSIPADG